MAAATTLMTRRRRRLVKRVGGAVAVAVAKGVAVAALAERVAAAAGVGREGGARRDERGGGGLEGVLEDRRREDASGVLVERAHLLHRAAVEADERARAGGGALDLLERQRDGGVVQVQGKLPRPEARLVSLAWAQGARDAWARKGRRPLRRAAYVSAPGLKIHGASVSATTTSHAGHTWRGRSGW